MGIDISALNAVDPMIIHEAPAAAIIPSFPHDVPTLVGVFGEEGCCLLRITPPSRAIVAFPRRAPVLVVVKPQVNLVEKGLGRDSPGLFSWCVHPMIWHAASAPVTR
jgi:hypothetical protein